MTTKTTTAGQSSYKVTVNRGEVYAVDGNDLHRSQDGRWHLPAFSKCSRGLPEPRLMGKQLGIHDLKPGMEVSNAPSLRQPLLCIKSPQSRP